MPLLFLYKQKVAFVVVAFFFFFLNSSLVFFFLVFFLISLYVVYVQKMLCFFPERKDSGLGGI